MKLDVNYSEATSFLGRDRKRQQFFQLKSHACSTQTIYVPQFSFLIFRGAILHLGQEPSRSLSVQDSQENFNTASLLTKLSFAITDKVIEKLLASGIICHDLHTLLFNLTFLGSYPWTCLQVLCRNRVSTLFLHVQVWYLLVDFCLKASFQVE